jgi:O-antigen/teichoic acid export membrane protein
MAAAIGVGINHQAIQREAVRAHVAIYYTRRFEEWRVLLHFSLPAFLAASVTLPITWLANVLLVNQPNGYVQMGIFNAANQWRIALLFLPGIISQPVVPVLSELYGKQALQLYRRALRLNLMATLGVTLLPAGIIAAASSSIMSAYGAQFADGRLTLIFLAFAAALAAVSGIIGSAIASMEKMWYGFGLNCIWGASFLIASSLLVKHGAQGLAIAYMVSYVVHLISTSLYVWYAMSSHVKSNT